MRIYLDTSVLPERRGIRSGAMSLLVALARRGDLELLVPSLVVEEFEHLRRARLAVASDSLHKALKSAYDHFAVPGIYIPDADEIIKPLLAELDGLVTVISLDPVDAVEALRREALRIPPARDGVGARDAGIWLTVIRHHASTDGAGIFFTRNTHDFADPASKGAPHPSLVRDLGDHATRFRFVFNPFEFLEEIAPRAEAGGPDVESLLSRDDVLSEIARAISDANVFTDEESGKSTGSDFSIWEIDPAELSVVTSDVINVHRVGDATVVKVKARIGLRLFSDESVATLEVTLWADVSADEAFVEVESIQRSQAD